MDKKFPSLLCTEEQALIMNVKKRNAEEKQINSDPATGLSFVFDDVPTDILVSGGNPAVRECIVSSLIRNFAGDSSVFFLHCGNAVFSHKLKQSRFAESRGGVLSLPVDPIAHCSEIVAAASIISRFAKDAEFPLSTSGYDMLEFYLSALMKLNGRIVLPDLRDLVAVPPAQVLVTLMHENLITLDDFNTDSERMKISIGEYPSVRRAVGRMAEIFGCLSGHSADVPSLYSVAAKHGIFELDMGSLDDDKLLLLNTLTHVCTQCLGQSRSRALFVLENIPKDCSASFDRLVATASGKIVKIISCSDVFSVCSGSKDRLNGMWSSVTNKIILRHSDSSADAISGMLGTCTQWRVVAGVGKDKGGLKLFPEKHTQLNVEADHNSKRVEPGEIRALDETAGFIVTESKVIVKTQVVS